MGTSSNPMISLAPIEDHPHACGDKELELVSHIVHEGSSPRVWGQAERRRKDERDFRIIPTRVGTSK